MDFTLKDTPRLAAGSFIQLNKPFNFIYPVKYRQISVAHLTGINFFPCLGIDVIDYFKKLAEETGVPYQNLINLYLQNCAHSQKKLRLKWAS